MTARSPTGATFFPFFILTNNYKCDIFASHSITDVIAMMISIVCHAISQEGSIGETHKTSTRSLMLWAWSWRDRLGGLSTR